METEPNQTSRTEETAHPAASPQNGWRKKLIGLVLGVFALAGIAYGIYWVLVARYDEYTDDAYVNGNVVQITPQVSGIVVAINADDTSYVKAGQTRVQLDQADAKVALDEADAQLAKTVRQVRNLFATSAQFDADIASRETDLAKARADLARREQLASSGAVSTEEIGHARDAVKAAQADLDAARQKLAASRALVDRTTIENHPDVQNAAAHVRKAYLDFARTTLPAPVSGFVAKRTVQLGQRVSTGAPLMAVVPLDEVWVDANFKENQLTHMRVGQEADLIADIYGNKAVYHGKIVGFGAGTGGAFALLPAQNASGNWIKIVQRIPVRIAFEPQELAAHPLQIGLSMQVDVYTRKRDGERLPQLAQSTPAYVTNVFQSLDEGADARAKSIIAANEGETARFVRNADHGNDGNRSSLVGVDGAKPRPTAPDKPF